MSQCPACGTKSKKKFSFTKRNGQIIKAKCDCGYELKESSEVLENKI